MVQKQNPFKVAEVEVSYKSNYNITERPKINSSRDAYQVLMQHWAGRRENGVLIGVGAAGPPMDRR